MAKVCSFSSSWEGQITTNQLQVPPHYPHSHCLPAHPALASYPHASPIPIPTIVPSCLLPDSRLGTRAGLMRMTCKQSEAALNRHQDPTPSSRCYVPRLRGSMVM